MSRKQKKPRNKAQKTARTGPVMSAKQSASLQQAAHAHAQGNLALAEAIYRSLVAEKVKAPHPYCNLAVICSHSDRDEEARALWVRALAIDPGSVQAAMGLAGYYERIGKIGKAIETFQGFLARKPGNVDAKYLLANLYKAQGKFEQATAIYEQIMAKRPDYAQAHFTYAAIHKYRDEDDPHIAAMLGLLQSGSLPVEGRTQLAFALSKAYEDLEDYPRAFSFLEQGNRLRRETFDYSIEGDEDLINNIIRTFNRDDLAKLRVESEPSARPIFIVGMVRSGTSLVEKILASHSDVHGAGELEYLYTLAGRLFLDPALRYQFRPLSTYRPEAFRTLGSSYLDKLSVLNDESPRVTDKMPFNMMMIGLIRLALPNAKIIHCVRDARDTCLSIYRQNFTTGNYRFAYDLKTTGQFHNLYRKLMRHWHDVFPGEIYDVEYEALTQSPEHEIRKLLEACELEWQDDCLHFNKKPGIVNTASFFQVRQPLYTTSVKLWQKYEAYLQPLFDTLEET